MVCRMPVMKMRNNTIFLRDRINPAMHSPREYDCHGIPGQLFFATFTLYPPYIACEIKSQVFMHMRQNLFTLTNGRFMSAYAFQHKNQKPWNSNDEYSFFNRME